MTMPAGIILKAVSMMSFMLLISQWRMKFERLRLSVMTEMINWKNKKPVRQIMEFSACAIEVSEDLTSKISIENAITHYYC